MRGILLLLVLVVGCGKTSFDGEADAQDSLDDHDGADTSCGDCDDRDPCTVDTCNPLTAECEHVPLDADEDSYAAIRSPDGTECGGDDCDDSDPHVYPGAPEVCLDGVDQDCDTVIDAFTAVTDEIILIGDDQVTGTPDIIWTGSEFGVAWWNGGTYEAPKNEAYFVRLDAYGTPIGEFVLANEITGEDAPGGGWPKLAWTGSEFGLAWETAYYDDLGYTSTFIEFTRFSIEGMKMGEDVVVARGPSDGLSSYYQPTIVWTGSAYGIAYIFNAEVFFSLLSPTGDRLDEETQVTDWVEYEIQNDCPSLAWTGSEFGLTWRHAIYPLFDFYLGFARLGPDGTKLMDDVIFEPVGGFYNSSLVWSGSIFAAAWDGFFSVFDELGNPTTDIIEIPAEPPHYARIEGPHGLVWTGSEFGMIVWGGTSENYYYHTIASDGTEHREVVMISSESHGYLSSAIAWTGSTIGAVWQARKEDTTLHDNGDIYFRLIGYCE